jgi:hypothetical protein
LGFLIETARADKAGQVRNVLRKLAGTIQFASICATLRHDRCRHHLLFARRAADIRALGAASLHVFGSTARGEARDDSDVDLFIDYDPDRFSFVELIRLRERLSEMLGRRADLATREGLHPLLRRGIEAEAIRVFY